MRQLLNISEASSIAIHSLAMLAKSNKPMNISQMASMTSFSKNHMAKVLQVLARHKYLGSSRGPNGGFFLKMMPENIKFLDVFELFEGKIEHLPCGIDDDDCPFETCVYGDAFYRLTQEFRNFYINRTIDDLLKEEKDLIAKNEKTNNKNR